MRKKFFKILSVILGCVILISFSACASLSYKRQDNSYGGAVTSLDDHMVCPGDFEYFTFFFCDYLFDKNQFEKDNVNFTFFYLIDGSKVFLESNCWESEIKHHGDIVEDNLYITLENPAIERSADYNIYNSDGFSLYEGNRKYYERIASAEQGVLQSGEGILVYKHFELSDSFPYEDYKMDIQFVENKEIRTYQHSENIKIPEELFVGENGVMYCGLTEFVKFEDGTVECMFSDGTRFFYSVQENCVIVSDKEFK